MAFESDPYRTLGLARGASLDEVKRAYRRLAKVNHPDAAGIGALPRFLAIQAAYEQLAGGSRSSGTKARGPAASPRGPSEADPDRADATRRAYGGRPRGRHRPPDEEGGRPRASGGARADAASGAAASGAAGEGRPGEGRPGGADPTGSAAPGASGRRGKATLGSTSYDGADAGPFEPDWGGASWYGTTSGTYWTINPKEYADPRKHGPEYQARARRASTAHQDAGTTAREVPHATEPDADTPEATDAAATAGDPRSEHEPPGRNGAPSGPTHSTSSWWNSTAGPAEGAADRPGWAATDPPVGEPPEVPEGPAPDPARAAADLARALTDPRSGGLRGRILRAFVGWLPIAFGLGWLFGELTGCGRFAATCDTSTDPLILAIQGGALVALLLLPVAASLAASAALGLLAAAVAATLVLSATGTAADEGSRRATLGVLLLIAWLAGLVIAVAQRLRSASSRAGPVS